MKNLLKIVKLKFLLVIIITTLVSVGCDDNANIVSPAPIAPKPYVPPISTTPVTSTKIDLTALRSFTSLRVTDNFSNTENYDGKIGNYYYYNYERLILDEVIIQNDKYQIPNLNTTSFAHDIALLIKPQSYTSETFNFNMSSIAGVSTYFNATQISILNNYFNNMYLADSDTKAGIYYSMAKTAVDNSSLTKDQKIAVVGIIEIGNEYAKGFFAGSWNTVYSNIQSQINGAINGRTEVGPCTINWRGVWAGAVVAGVGGAIKGAIAGGTAGTFTVPILGTATGAVGGGVFGFAAGFAGGVAGGVVTELLINCLFKEEGTKPNLDCNYFKYAQAHPSLCQTEMDQLKKWYILYYL